MSLFTRLHSKLRLLLVVLRTLGDLASLLFGLKLFLQDNLALLLCLGSLQFGSVAISISLCSFLLKLADSRSEPNVALFCGRKVIIDRDLLT